MPDFATPFDGSTLKLLFGINARTAGKDNFYTGGIGTKFYFGTWASATLSLPYKDCRGTDRTTDRHLQEEGQGDMSLTLSIDILEKLCPTMVKKKCPDTGLPYYESLNKDKFLKSPHLSLSLSVSMPTGADDRRDYTWVVPVRYQPGTGVWTPGVSAYFSRGVGCVTPGLGIGYTFSGGENSVAYRRAPHMSFNFGATYLLSQNSRLRANTSLSWDVALRDDEQNGKPVNGTKGTTLSLDLGVAISLTSDATGGITMSTTLSDSRSTSQKSSSDGTALGIFLAWSF